MKISELIGDDLLVRMAQASRNDFTSQMFVALMSKLVKKDILTVDEGIEIMLTPIESINDPLIAQIRETLKKDIIGMKEKVKSENEKTSTEK